MMPASNAGSGAQSIEATPWSSPARQGLLELEDRLLRAMLPKVLMYAPSLAFGVALVQYLSSLVGFKM
ncbi:MAG TPA: hypothetical protein VEC02_02365 [Nitrososphaerales archaeon]|nr:hypothetical protein [Nitrososphaerales archaeon]